MQLPRPIVGILQPSYLPWLGSFDMMSRCDYWVFHDDTQYTKQDWRNRNRIKSPDGFSYLTVPVVKSSHTALIKDIKISYEHKWHNKHLERIRSSYAGGDNLKACLDLLQAHFSKAPESLAELSANLTIDIARLLGIQATFLNASSLGCLGKSQSKVIALCKALGAKTYINGAAGRKLYAFEDFEKEGMALVFHDYQHPSYQQPFGPFMSHLSIVDLLCSHPSDQALQIIRSGSSLAHGQKEVEG